MAIVEDDVAGMGALLAHLLVPFAELDARRAALDQERGNAVGTFVGRRGARHHGEEPGLRRVGDEALGAVEDIAVAIAPRGRLQGGGVGAGIRFGQREGADDLAGRELGQVAALLLLGPVHDDALGADAVVGADERAERGRGLADLEGEARLFLHGEAKAAIFGGDSQAEHAEFFHLGDHLRRNSVFLRDLELDRDQPLLNEARHGFAQLIEGFAIQRHAPSPSGSTAGGCATGGLAPRMRPKIAVRRAFTNPDLDHTVPAPSARTQSFVRQITAPLPRETPTCRTSLSSAPPPKSPL